MWRWRADVGKFLADVTAWSDKALRNVDLVLKASAQDVGELMQVRQASKKETGTYVEGKVPVDKGVLVGSLRARLNGGTVAVGVVGQGIDMSAAVAGFEAGDVLEVAYTAGHARPMEYGSGTRPGRFFVRNAVIQWDAIVQANAARFKD